MTAANPDSTKELRVPALGVCGWKGSGKTVLLEAALQVLKSRGLRVLAVKHDAHGVDLDHPGKDSDRLFRAGADVLLQGPAEEAERRHRGPSDGFDLLDLLNRLPPDHDLILVEGHKTTPIPKVWLRGPDGDGPPPEATGIIDVLDRGGNRIDRFLALLDEWHHQRWRARHVLGGILIGGAGRRMGFPKRMMERQGRPVIETVAGALELHTGQVVLLGGGEIPAAAGHLARLPDPPGTAGPIAGMAAAMRWAPAAAWIFAACDLPLLRSEAIAWLVDQRRPGRWAVLPHREAGPEPLLALYEPQIHPLLEDSIDRGRLAPRLLAGHPAVFTPEPPAAIADCWTNVNSPEDLTRLDGS